MPLLDILDTKRSWAMGLVFAAGSVAACGGPSGDSPTTWTKGAPAPLVNEVCAGDFRVTNASELAALASCTEITGYLQVYGQDIRDLTALSQLSRVGGDLSVNETNLTSLHGLEALQSVGGGMELVGNSKMVDVDALESLQSIEGVLTIGGVTASEWLGPATLTKLGGLHVWYTESLQHLGGFAGLREVGSLVLENNAALKVVDGMPALTTIRETAAFMASPQLETVSGFVSLDSVGYIHVANDPQLVSFALPSVTTAGTVQFSECSKLSRIDLKRLVSVGTLSIGYGMPALMSLEGFRSLTSANDIGLSETGVTNLHDLARLETVSGRINLGRTQIEDLVGLENVTTLGGLGVGENPRLVSLRGLDKLEKLSSFWSLPLSIEKNDALTELGGLNALTEATGPVEIRNNRRLTQLNGLRNLRSARGLWVSGNALTSLDGLGSLTTIVGTVQIGEASLTTLTGLRSLTSVTDLWVTDCNALENLSGLETLRTIDFGLRVQRNPRLTYIDDFPSLTRLGYDLRVTNNASLPACRADSFLTRIRAQGFDGSSEIHDNGGTGSCNIRP